MAAAGDIYWTSLIPGLSWVEKSLPHPETGEPALHVSNAILIGLIILTLAFLARARIRTENLTDEDLVPEGRLTVRTVMEVMVSAILGIMRDSMGHVAPRFLFLVGTLGFFILFSNLSGLVPGFSAPTGNLNTTLACALVVFAMTHVYGFREHGVSYLKHFAGPFWWLAWLMIPIEIISHLARPMSLSLRLFGNMTGEHKVGAVFFMLVPFGVPIFTLVLGIFVGTIQTFVFMLLTMVYFSGAIEHGEH
ncbi:MAG: F0F1 ATP synthase subunit A [Deferrisomatales bacterium]|nr:F0F1 ATP synthase subunit A [Deferrisomatales bacterium]